MRNAAPLLLGLCCTVCQPSLPCDGVDGSCLELHIDGAGTFDNMRSTALGAMNTTLKIGETGTSVTIPATLRLSPPPGISTSAITSINVDALVGSQISATGSTANPFSWPDGAHIEATVNLSAAAPIPPGPFLTWRQETAPTNFTKQLFDVWVNPTGEPVIAVGEMGGALVRSGGTWKAEATSSTSLLGGVFGVTGGTAWAAGQISPGVWRRDGSTMTWSVDQPAGLTGKGFWCAAAGQSPGEIWAGDNDGKVWHRTGPTTGGGTWVGEQALPAGTGIYGIAYADGAVFAVGDAGNVAVRPNAGPPWVTKPIGGNVAPTDWFNSVWAFDRNTAIAVGTSGFLISFQGGQWGQAAQKIDTSNGEMTGVWGMDSSRVWVSSKDGQVLRVDGTTIYKLFEQTGVALNAIYGISDTNIYVVGGATGQPSYIVHGTP